jgi:hypothetical protein
MTCAFLAARTRAVSFPIPVFAPSHASAAAASQTNRDDNRLTAQVDSLRDVCSGGRRRKSRRRISHRHVEREVNVSQSWSSKLS